MDCHPNAEALLNLSFQRHLHRGGWPHPPTSRSPQSMQAMKVTVGYLLKSGMNQSDAIDAAKRIVDIAAERSISGDRRDAVMGLDRLALEVAVAARLEALGKVQTVVPQEIVRPMTQAAPTRLVAPLRAETWRSATAWLRLDRLFKLNVGAADKS
ncbi:hypothetical protein Poly51_04710 [Rubripirellula tenax]|uniref:Uncharacterized protein n=1 Tax=Rubripirellula tenax TaxID=2528015 RepID=A0A5C6FEF8_9BACT|nr:hypothetical protein [Rubripirellula tenax]TWU60196.1 hypothetical protein Poly51_04710 [Rubripirellula tenax]